MNTNKKTLSKAKSELNKVKLPSKPKDIIYDPMGQWKFPGQPTRIPGNNITMDDVSYPVMAYPDFGLPVMMYPEEEYNFPGAKYVDEYPEMRSGGNTDKHVIVKQSTIKGADKGLFSNQSFKKNQLIGLAHRDGQPVGEIGKMHNHSDKPNMYSVKKGNERHVYAKRDIKAGEELTTDYKLQPELEQPDDFKKGGLVRMPKPSKKGTTSKAYSKSLEATNKLFTENKLFAKPKSKKRRVFDPNASFYEDGGQSSSDNYVEMDLTPEEIQVYREGGYVVEEVPEYKQGGALLTKKVTCKKCGWTWDAADGGDDITTCHKCGSQGLVHAQKGGYKENIKETPSLPLMEGRTAYKRWVYGVNDKMAMEEDGGFIELELDDKEIEQYRKGGYVVEEIKYQDGGVTTVPTMEQSQAQVIPPMLAPDMIPTGELVAPPTVTEPIIDESVQQSTNPVSNQATEQSELTKKEVEKIAMPKIMQSGDVKAIQKKLVAAGYNIGTTGPNRNGVDGDMGNKTQMALDAFNAGIPPSKLKTVEPKKQSQSTKYVVNKNLGTGYLPYLDKGEGEEVCVEGKGCSFNVSIKMSNLLGEIADGNIWANDAWFNKSDVLNKGGDLIYETTERDMAKMPKVPKDVYAKLQVGDYVQLNRMDTKTSGEFASETKGGLENENVEHLGFVVGKDKDGTPLIWHASEKGKAFIKRLDEPISLDDHDKSIFTYQVASIVRSPSLKNADLSGLQNTPYYSTIDPKQRLVANEAATERQKQATGIINNNIRNIKNLGYSQEDANLVGQILIGGIMQQETKGGESNKRIPKQIAATVWKDVLGQEEFEGDEPSIGYYQMKPTLNFVNKDGSLNALGKKLEKLGVDPKDIGTFDIEAQTKAGAIILLNNYEKLKKDKDFNVKTGLYKGKIPASYILAKSWQAGSDWYKREKYQKYINNFDIDYSNNALSKALNTVGNTSSTNQLQKEYDIVKKGIAAREKASEEAKKIQYQKERVKEAAEKAKERAEYEKNNPNFEYAKRVPSESTAVNNPYKESNFIKPFNANEQIKKPVIQNTIYKYPGRPGVTYKKDSNGNWYINTGTSKDKAYIPIKDPSGTRTKALAKGAVKAKEGGIVTNLTQDEINAYIKQGYVIEQID